MSIAIRPADLNDPRDAQAIVDLTDAYAKDPMGGGDGLSDFAKERLVEAMKAHPACHAFLAFVDGVPVGIANCFVTFSSFKAAPILNIHDIAVLREYRGLGIASQLLAAVEERARSLGCAYVSLEANIENEHARRVYARHGFQNTEPGPDATLFCRKPLAEA